MFRTRLISDLPSSPALYALLGGKNQSAHVAYVGIAGKLRDRIQQHLELRNSSVTTAVGPVRLDPEQVREVRWWLDSSFEDRAVLQAAELIAFEVFQPVLRSRGAVGIDTRSLATSEAFSTRIREMLRDGPSGILTIPTLFEALERIDRLELRLSTLEEMLRNR